MTQTAKEYASALFSLAVESDQLNEIFKSLKQIKQIFRENPSYPLFLASPSIPKEERIKGLMEAFWEYPEYVRSFLAVLVEHGEVREFDACLKEFTLFYQDLKKQVTAVVTSASPLSDAQKQRLKEKLEKQSGRQVEMICQVDPSLLAGMRVSMEETVFDGSVKRRLQKLKEEIGV